MSYSFKKGDSVRFLGGMDAFTVERAEDDDILLCHPETNRLFEVDWKAIELYPATLESRLAWAESMLERAKIIYTTLDGPGADVWLDDLEKGPQ